MSQYNITKPERTAYMFGFDGDFLIFMRNFPLKSVKITALIDRSTSSSKIIKWSK
jgi:hypothetical protein